MSFRERSIILVGSVIIISFAITAYFIGEKMTQSTRKMSVDLALSKANNSLLVVQTEIEKTYKQAETIVKAIEEIATQGDIHITEEILLSGLKESSELSGRWFVKPGEDKVQGIYLEKQNDSIISREISPIQIGLVQKYSRTITGIIFSQPYKNLNGNELITVLSPVNTNSKLPGIIGFDIDLQKFQQTFYDMESLGRAYVTIISNNGICITHPDQKLIGKQLGDRMDSVFVQKALKTGLKQQAEVHSEFLNLPVIRGYQPVKIGENNEFFLITVSVPLFNIKESVVEMRNSVILIGVVLALLLMVFLYFSQRRWLYEATQRQRAEADHRNVLLKLSAIMENSDQIMIFSVDKEYRYTSFNTVYKEEIKKQEQSSVAVDKSLLDVYYGDFRIEMKKHIDRALRGEHFLVEYQRHGIYYQQVFNAIANEKGEVVGVSSFCFDISETIHLREKARKEEEEKVKAELKNLKNQINPHFLFNSLNSLFALVEEQPELARKFIIKLSKVYRYLLDSSNSNLIALQQELDFIRHYLFLQKIRFGESLDMDIDIRPDLLRKKLPSASLQSLVENAIKHNRITENNPLLIKIFSNDQDQLVVENNYQPRTELVHSPGTGLKNLSALYQHLGCNSLSYGFDNGKYRVQLPLL